MLGLWGDYLLLTFGFFFFFFQWMFHGQCKGQMEVAFLLCLPKSVSIPRVLSCFYTVCVKSTEKERQREREM